MPRAQRVFERLSTPLASSAGNTLDGVGVALYFHLFRAAEIWLLDHMPGWLLDLSVRY